MTTSFSGDGTSSTFTIADISCPERGLLTPSNRFAILDLADHKLVHSEIPILRTWLQYCLRQGVSVIPRNTTSTNIAVLHIFGLLPNFCREAAPRQNSWIGRVFARQQNLMHQRSAAPRTAECTLTM